VVDGADDPEFSDWIAPRALLRSLLTAEPEPFERI